MRLGSSTDSLRKFVAVYTPEGTKRPALGRFFGPIWSRILIEQESLTRPVEWGPFTQKQRSRYPF